MTTLEKVLEILKIAANSPTVGEELRNFAASLVVYANECETEEGLALAASFSRPQRTLNDIVKEAAEAEG
jgi:hypothetical protein